MTTITAEQQEAITARIAHMHLPAGLGTEEEACSLAAINLALTGRLTDEIPPCMSHVIGKWMIVVQDAMPDELRNSPGWRALIPLSAGTGRDPAVEELRSVLLVDWLWVRVLPVVQPVADEGGYGTEWAAMLAAPPDAWAAWAARAAGAAEAAGAAGAAWAAGAAGAAEAAGAAWAAGAARAAVWDEMDPVGTLAALIACE